MKRVAIYIAALLITSSIPASLFAQTDIPSLGKTSEQPINITSRKFEAKNLPKGKEAVFDGDVKVRQGDLVLSCDRLAILYDEEKAASADKVKGKSLPAGLQSVSGIKSIAASGNVKMVQGERMATAGKALYDNVERTITLTEGPPRLWQGPDVLVANTIIVYLDENRSELKGNTGTPGNEGIRMIINPGKGKGTKQ
ncbi:MAG: LptA/OstA family protein [Pseudomonadota bacterium]